MIGWFVLLVAGVVVYRLVLARVRELESSLTRQQRTIDDLAKRLDAVSRAEAVAQARPATASPAEAPLPKPVQEPAAGAPPPRVVPEPRPVLASPRPVEAPSAAAPPSAPPRPIVPPPPSRPAAPPPPPRPPFDWESLIGVKLFSGIAGIALVLA